MPEGPWLYPEDQAADIPSRLLAAEITREKIYLRLHDELPYASAVETEKWEERKDGSVKIDQVIYVQRDGQKAIVLGKGGATIKIIGELARKEMEEMFGRRVHLFLFVKVREDWAEKREHYREIGLDFRMTDSRPATASGAAATCSEAALGRPAQVAMEWTTRIVLSAAPHGETGAILELLTRDHGRHAGLVRGGASRRASRAAAGQQRCIVHWRARLAGASGQLHGRTRRARAPAS